MAPPNDAGDGDDDKPEMPVVLITGCANGGIGYEYCKAFASLGCRVVATDVPDRVPDLAGLDADHLPLDVTSDESVEGAVARVLAEHGRVDVLVNNAGIGCTGPLAELRGEAVRRAMDVNFLGQLRMVRAVAPHMASRRSGRVVNVGSVVGTAATPWAGPYCASKAAVHAATDALRVELRPFGVHVVKVVPRRGEVRAGPRQHGAARRRAGGVAAVPGVRGGDRGEGAGVAGGGRDGRRRVRGARGSAGDERAAAAGDRVREHDVAVRGAGGGAAVGARRLLRQALRPRQDATTALEKKKKPS
ncbi:Os12g0633800 [Oryza sativa Japonica Group]|uniref:Os12g0633800 protein n=1 Tax=Oryza sativa subsp. japonica TaxID=39947 RepID=Q2QLP7_ORYSJ|nr:oxidoreductase, short chain dehydrogenase/reductase family protein, expressed [Oryza sativa Japonica Group]BAT18237.1 Os12g0633800 [Oryza sativa Japonica Group]